MAELTYNTTYLERAANSLKNIIINATGSNSDFFDRLERADISNAVNMMQNRDADVEKALKEYDPEQHWEVMHRPDKIRQGKTTYRSEKLPRALQKSINETEVWFLLENPIEFRNDTPALPTTTATLPQTDVAFDMFNKLLKDVRFNTRTKQAKRIAGAETESAKYYRIYRDIATNHLRVKCSILCRQEGYSLRPMFDEYGDLIAFGWMYRVKTGDMHYSDRIEIETATNHYIYTKNKGGWDMVKEVNLTGKINVIYYRQEKAWKGAEARITRLELIDSKIADVNNYFSAPKMIVPADVLHSLPDSTRDAGEVILTKGDVDHSKALRYLEFPTAPELQKQEIDNLIETIQMDTLTPPFDFKSMSGLGSLSGEAIERAMALGMIKRALNIEIYQELIDREVSLLKAILPLVYPEISAGAASQLDITATFVSPFVANDNEKWRDISLLYERGAISAETAVTQLNLYEDSWEEEVTRLKERSNNADINTLTKS